MNTAPRSLLAVEKLSRDEFQSFGTAVLEPQDSPTSCGEGFECWFGVGTLNGLDFQVGQVIAQKPPGGITRMERHDHPELLLPITGAVVQVVAPRGDFADLEDCPDGAAARAFLIEPGEAVLIDSGTWHAAAVPVDEKTLYYFAAVPDEPGTAGGAWMPFSGHERFELSFD